MSDGRWDGRTFGGRPLSGSYEPGEFLRRYQAGEREAVWREMTALGPAARDPPYVDDAWATARETMKRALDYVFWNGERGTQGPPDLKMSIGGRMVAFDSPLAAAQQALNIDLSRIPAGMGRGAQQAQQMLAALIGPYQAAKAKIDAAQQARTARQTAITDHLKDPLVLGPPTADEINFIRGLEKKGMLLPLAWRAWIEEVGDVNLAGRHPALCFWDHPGFAGVYADPLMVTLDHFHFEIEAWEEAFDDGETPEGFDAIIAWDPQAKARLAIEKQVLDCGYSIAVPNAAADGPVLLNGRETLFVDYLRNAFRWGGFPGWAGQPNPPEAELKILTEGLLPI